MNRATLAAAMAVLFATTMLAQNKPLPARGYYDELKAANQFDHYSDTYVCFRDDHSPSFAIISRGSDIIDEMEEAGHAPSKAVMQAKNQLFVQTYFKGVASPFQKYAPVAGSAGIDWEIEFRKPFHGKMVYSIDWATGRYRRRMYALDVNKELPADYISGKCELIHQPDDPSAKLQPLFDNRCFKSKTPAQQRKLVEQVEALPESEFTKTMDGLDAMNAADRLLGTQRCEAGQK